MLRRRVQGVAATQGNGEMHRHAGKMMQGLGCKRMVMKGGRGSEGQPELQGKGCRARRCER